MIITLLTTVEHPVVHPEDAVGPQPLPGHGGFEMHRTTADGFVRSMWKIPEGAIIDMPDVAAKILINLGYARVAEQAVEVAPAE